jgi:phosphopantothenate-cysteine ligase/phosphopantothenoylcysteine decarboxylase/phosphopantothenate--cysteine ligase
MNILVTAGNTLVLIDKVRAITNIFTGRTGAGIALHFHRENHAVTLATSQPDVVSHLKPPQQSLDTRWQLIHYR